MLYEGNIISVICSVSHTNIDELFRVLVPNFFKHASLIQQAYYDKKMYAAEIFYAL